MFTGIIQALGTIKYKQSIDGDMRLHIHTGELGLTDVVLGDSIAVNGVCLTAVELTTDGFVADVSAETLSKTTLGNCQVSDQLNLEKALTLQTPLGGHLVSGHVDGIGKVLNRQADARSVRFLIQLPNELAKYIAAKGSVCIDGTSLTVNSVNGNEFDINIVPHTLDKTIIGAYAPGTSVNVEIDVVARYLERLLLGEKAAEKNNGANVDANAGISKAFLTEHGFTK